MALDVLIGMALVLGVMILVHEWGHFIVARLFGVRVDVFSVGFGPRLFGWKRGATDYRVSALPLGGYVRMAGQDLSEVDSGVVAPTGAPDELMSKPRWQRALISFAGPAVNLVFPLLLLGGFFTFVGMPYPTYWTKPVEVTAVPPQMTDLKSGDVITSVNGEPVSNWEQAEKALKSVTAGQKIRLEVLNQGNRRDIEALPKGTLQLERPLGYLPIPPIIDDIEPGKPAQRAGIREDDTVLAVNGQKIQVWDQFVEHVRGSEGKPLDLEIERKGQILNKTVTPQQGLSESGETVYQIGVSQREDISYRKVTFSESVNEARLYTLDFAEKTVSVVGKLFSGRVSVRQLQSVVGISRAAGHAVHRGPLSVILLMSFMSINLGILNLLPIPILDGGNILLLTMEGIRRRDFSLRFKERFVQVGLVFLLVLFAYVMYNDVVRLLPTHS
ncbi:MAG TPA: RIP metalloprotease RseP [Candidatus Acidoferrum sp.]|nr:RIP metalloprotease RseP [Candidatus Acidoferrum sp.]